jgi:hypothetical protein
MRHRAGVGFEGSNLAEDAWPEAACLVDDMYVEANVRPAELGRFTEFSEVQAYRFPSGTPSVTDQYLLAVLDVGLPMMRRAGLPKKRTDFQFMYFSEFGNGSFEPVESVGGCGWGHMDIQAAHGSRSPGWVGTSTNGPSAPSTQSTPAAGERDRILAAIRRWT